MNQLYCKCANTNELKRQSSYHISINIMKKYIYDININYYIDLVHWHIFQSLKWFEEIHQTRNTASISFPPSAWEPGRKMNIYRIQIKHNFKTFTYIWYGLRFSWRSWWHEKLNIGKWYQQGFELRTSQYIPVCIHDNV